MENLPTFKRAYVVSDLHLGGKPNFQMFSEGIAFKRFCQTLANEVKPDSPTLLVINGDFVDFLAEDHSAYWNGGLAVDFLKAIAGRDPFSHVFDGLRAFLAKPGAQLVITLGNHDLELSLPNVRSELIEQLTDGVANRRSRIQLAFDGWGYRFQVGHAKALATHGNEVDEYNFTRYDILNQIFHELSLFGSSQASQGWKPSAGTVFVIDALNRIKQRYPFVDLLKPEIPVAFLAVTVLAPSNLAVAEDVARLKATAVMNESSRPSSERRFLNVDDLPQTPAAVGRELAALGAERAVGETEAKIFLLEEKANQYLDDPNRNIDDLIYGMDADELLGLSDWVQGAKRAIAEMVDAGVGVARTAAGWVVDQATEAGKAAHVAALRTALVPFVETESFEVNRAGDGDRSLGEMIRDDYDVVFAGHSHIRRFFPRGANRRGHYVNTGTWAGVMRLFPNDLTSDAAFRPIFDLMIGGDRNLLVKSKWVRQERPVAVLREVSAGKTDLKLLSVGDDGKLAPYPPDKRTHETQI